MHSLGLSESKGGAHRPPVEAHAGSEVPGHKEKPVNLQQQQRQDWLHFSSNKSLLPICGKGKVGLVCRGWYSGRIKADIFLLGLHIPVINNLLSFFWCHNLKVPIKAVQGIKSFGHSNLTEIQVTRNKGDIGGKFSANVLHKGGVPANALVIWQLGSQ